MKIQNLKLKRKNLNPGINRGSFGSRESLKDLRCSKCNKLFGKEAIEKGVLEVKCHRCGSIERFNFKKIEKIIQNNHSPP